MNAWVRAFDLLRIEGVSIPPGSEEACLEFCGAVRAANRICSLVSHSDESLLEEVHLPDSLSLAPWILRRAGLHGPLLDIGPGGGFPAIPIALLFPERPMALVERSEKKAGFLQRMIGLLKLEHVRVLVGEFPRTGSVEAAKVVTARAVERPEKLQAAILARVPLGASFFSQNGLPLQASAEMFHVEQVVDDWTQAGLRRGRLQIITRTQPDQT